jgi:ribosomal protein S18 acetylase RimI-like enzyme
MVEYRVVTKLDEKRAAIEACDHAFSNPVSQRDSYENLMAKIHANADFIAAYRQEPIGYLAIYANDTVSKTAYISLLAVKPEYQKMHIGASLLEAGLALSRERGMKMVKLEVNTANAGAIRLYERMGFIRLCDAGAHTVYMMKHLDGK